MIRRTDLQMPQVRMTPPPPQVVAPSGKKPVNPTYSPDQRFPTPISAPTPGPQYPLTLLGDITKDKLSATQRVKELINLCFEVEKGHQKDHRKAVIILAQQLIKNPSPSVRLVGVDMLALLKQSKDLIPMAADPNPHVRQAVAGLQQQSRSPVTTGNHVKLLREWVQVKTEMLKMIDGAKRSIQVDNYLLNGYSGNMIADHLMARAKAGVKVEVMLDPNDGYFPETQKQTRALIEKMKKAGVSIAKYPLDWLSDPEYLLKGHFQEMSRCDHNKILVVDQQSFLVGGQNWDDGSNNNRDFMLKITGPAAQTMGTSLQIEHRLTIGNLTKPLPTLPVAKPGNVKVEVRENSLLRQDSKKMILDSIAGAKKKIQIGMFQFSSVDVIKALRDASKRGVQIQVILDQNRYLDLMGYHTASELTKIYGVPNLVPAMGLQTKNIEVKWYQPKSYEQHHAKYFIIDDKIVMTGSSNLTHNAFNANRETFVKVESPELAADLNKEMFAPDWKKGIPTSKIGFGVVEKVLGSGFDLMEKSGWAYGW